MVESPSAYHYIVPGPYLSNMRPNGRCVKNRTATLVRRLLVRSVFVVMASTSIGTTTILTGNANTKCATAFVLPTQSTAATTTMRRWRLPQPPHPLLPFDWNSGIANGGTTTATAMSLTTTDTTTTLIATALEEITATAPPATELSTTPATAVPVVDALATDPAILIGGSVATLALLGLVFTLPGMWKDDARSGRNDDYSGPSMTSPNAVPLKESTEDDADAATVTAAVTATIPAQESQVSMPAFGDVDDAWSTQAGQILEEVEATSSSSSDGTTFDPSAKGGRVRRLLQGLVDQGRAADAAVQRGQVEQRALQVQLSETAERLADAQDAYELEQNRLQRVQRQLTDTADALQTTQRQLEDREARVQSLEAERRSLRQLGRVAWQLSRDRVVARWEKWRPRRNRRDSSQSNGGGNGGGTDET